ncbi:MAG: metallophosphoesterase [Acidimicrobiales bacterium]
MSVFAVDDTTVQVTWRDLPPGPVEVLAAGRSGAIEHPGGPGAVRVGGLTPWRSVDVVVRAGGTVAARQRVRTGAPGLGAELFRFATVSDLHLGETRFGFFGTIREQPEPDVPHPVRCLRQALRELRAWGAALVVVKGDLTHVGRRSEWELAGAELAASGMPTIALVGNHDARPARPCAGRRSGHHGAGGRRPADRRPRLARWRRRARARRPRAAHRAGRHDHRASPRRHLRPLSHTGRRPGGGRPAPGSARVRGRPPLPDAATGAALWPPGVPPSEASRFFATLAAANPAAFYSAGHTHRHRRYRRHGIPATEVGSPKDYPGTWAGYTVHEGGIRQTVWRVGTPDVLRWTEHSRRAALGAWGLWSPGRLRDRCFWHRWPALA